MKVIEGGVKSPQWWEGKQIRCAYCQCLYELESADAAQINVRTNDREGYVAANCPDCGRGNSIGEEFRR